MECSVLCSNANDTFLQLNEVLRDMNVDVNRVTDHNFTEKLINCVHEFTLSLQNYEQRKKLTEVDLETVIKLVQSLLVASRNYSPVPKELEKSDTSRRNFLTECVRLLRNACAECSRNQLVVNTHGQLATELAGAIIRSVTSTDHEDVNLMRCSIQFASNAVIGCPNNARLFWDAFFPAFRLMLVVSNDAKLQQYTCCLMYNCLVNDQQHSCMQQLVSSESGLQAVSAVIQYLDGTDCEWALFIIEKILSWEQSAEPLWSLLSNSQRNLLLDVTASRLKQLTDVNEESHSEIVSLSNMLHFAAQFCSVCETLCELLLNNSETNEQQLELSVARQLLECLCLATTSILHYRLLCDHAKLLSSSLELLKGLHEVGKSGVNALSVASKPVPETKVSPLIFGIKSDILRLLGNLVYQHHENQNLVRTLGGIPVILDHTRIDSNNPYVVQWSIFAVRNLCESNICNQRLIADLNYQGLAPQAER